MTDDLSPLELPNPAKKKNARILAFSIYRYAQHSLNRLRFANGIELVPDFVPIPRQLIDAMAIDSDGFTRDLGRVLQFLEENKPLEADELYRNFYQRMREASVKQKRRHLAGLAAKHKSAQASKRKREVVELAARKLARRPGRSKRAIALDISRDLGLSEETIRKYLAPQKPKKRPRSA